MKRGSVLDTSALLAWLWAEPGQQAVQQALNDGGCHLSSVNLAEFLTKGVDSGMTVEAGLKLVDDLELIVQPCDATQAAENARLRLASRSKGLSLGDRACFALARQLGLSVLTADRAWLQVDAGVTVEFIRPSV